MLYNNSQRGITLVEALLMAGLIAVFFVGLLSAFRGIFELVTDSKVRQTALTVAMQTVETVRGLEYEAVGTIGGVPAGVMPQVSTTTQNNVVFTTSILIEFVDDPADGLAELDSNGIITDYKRVAVTVEWENRRNELRSLQFVTQVSPPGIESDIGGGTLRVNVFDSSLQPVSGATVRLINTTTDPAIDTIRISNANGIVLFSGAPTASQYEIEVSRTGYSTDQTYIASGSLVNPLVPPVTVVEGSVTTATFFIERLSQLNVKTVSSQTNATVEISVTDGSDVATSTNVAVSGGGIALSDGGGVYADAGSVLFTTIAPASLVAWQAIEVEGQRPGGTARIIQVYDGANPGELIPESVLPGNAAGFGGDYIALASIDAATYSQLQLRIRMETINTSVTPTVTSFSVAYVASEVVLPDTQLVLTGNRSIGTDGGGDVVPKYNFSVITDSAGEYVFTDIAPDFYTITVPGYVIEEACSAAPLTIAPDMSQSLRLQLGAVSPTSLRVHVVSATGLPISGATVTVSRPGFSETGITSSCGQTFFPAPPVQQYTVTVTASGYTTETITAFNIVSNDLLIVQLSL